jgi:hypothetical protein
MPRIEWTSSISWQEVSDFTKPKSIRPHPSARFAGMETAARRICELSLRLTQYHSDCTKFPLDPRPLTLDP